MAAAAEEEEEEAAAGGGGGGGGGPPQVRRVTLTLSMRQPWFETLTSLPIRKRSTTLWPAAAAGRLTVVVTNPLELPVQACRPASGFAKVVEIVPL